MQEAQRSRWDQGWRRALRIATAVLLFPGSLFLAYMILGFAFWSPVLGKIELHGPAGQANRAYIELDGFVDVGLYLRVSDWPFTFWHDLHLDGRCPFKEPSRFIHWSGDGSVIAVRKHNNGDGPPRFETAYDFKTHRQEKNTNPVLADHDITALLKARGGIGPDVAFEVDDPKLPQYHHDSFFPWWGKVLPVLSLLGGVIGTVLLARSLRRSPAHRSGNLHFAKNGQA